MKRSGTLCRILLDSEVLLAVAGVGEARTKTAILRLNNGDMITCEIKQMQQGLVNIKATYLKDTVAIKWVHVEQVESEQLFQVETTDGTKYFGSIGTSEERLTMIVVTDQGNVTVNHDDAVRIAPIDESFWERLHGDVDFGLTTKKANNEKQYNLTGSVTYRTRKYRLSANLNSFVTRLNDDQSTKRSDLGVGYRRALRGKWFWTVLTKFENNQELGLDLRTSLAGGGGIFLIQSSQTEMSLTAGLTGNEEQYVGATESQANLEGLLLLEYRLFLFGSRETSISILGAAIQLLHLGPCSLQPRRQVSTRAGQGPLLRCRRGRRLRQRSPQRRI